VLGLGWLHVGLFALPMAEIVRVAGMAMIALLTVIVLATLNGALVPVVLTRLGLDPAVSMGPFVTTANDILGLTIYFSVATALLV
jgi:magnesium transporter